MRGINKFFILKRSASLILALLLVLSFTCSYAQEAHQMVIVTFGNSTTAPRKGINKVYAIRLGEILKEKGIDNKVINAGVPGSHSGSIIDNDFFKITHGLDRFDTAVLRYDPDWVTINFGLNDSWQDKGVNGASRISVSKYRQNLTFYIDKIREKKGNVILLTPNPIGKKFDGFHKTTLKKYLKVTRKLSRKEKVPLIDTWKLFYRYVKERHEELDTLLLDGIHPGDTGHELIAKAIAKIILHSSK
jgi:lysophospholipase L1-like esterase